MYSRAHLLIQRQLEKIEADDPWGIEVVPLKGDNMFELGAKILGLHGTIWEGGIFRFYLKFDETYSYTAPEVCFHTIPFHPNIDMITGRPCVDFLIDPNRWRESYTIGDVVKELQKLLANPELDTAVNVEATDMLMYTPDVYEEVVKECVAASRRVEAGLKPHPSKNEAPVEPAKPPPAVTKGRVSFEDYHLTWSNIATSKTAEQDKNALLESIRGNSALEAAHYGLPLEELQMQLDKQYQEHTSIMYGKFPEKPSQDGSKEARIEKLNQMRKIYLQPRTPFKSLSKENTVTPGRVDEEPWEREVDDLVQWTDKLDDDNL